MSRQIFGDAADVGQLLQVGVHLLVAAYGKQHAARLAVGVFPVTVDNLLRLVKQRNVAHVFGLLPRLANPDLAVDVRHEMLRLELLHVRKGQPRQTTETEDVADLRQSGNRDLLVKHRQKLLFLQKRTVDRLHVDMFAVKRVLRNPSVALRDADDLLEVFQILHHRIVNASPYGLHVELIILDQMDRQFVQIEVLGAILL